LVEQGDDHGAALLCGKLLFEWFEKRGWSCVSAVIHRNGALLLKVMYLKLGKLREAEACAVIGFAADSHA
jgi:hypothetical protein